MKTGRSALTVLVALSVLCPLGQAATLDQALNYLLSQTNADTLIPVLIRPRGTISGAAMKQDAASRFATRADRHRAVVTKLKDIAEKHQPAVTKVLNGPRFAGRITDVRRFWIDNAITAKMTPTAIAELSQHSQVAEILYLPPVEFFSDSRGSAGTVSHATAGVAQPGLLAIKADSLWRMGYTGKGRLVGSIDTGFDGEHPFLTDKWRGHNGYSVEESWLDPMLDDTIPRIHPEYVPDHGTEVVGIMVAIQESVVPGDSTLDTVGVAFDAQWIAASVVTQEACHILEGIQWMADPDGDPNTESDVPDVVANSWGIGNHFIGCSDVFWNAIDNVEAAGAAMIFSAGNFGPFSTTVVNPANRTSSLTNSFAVGMIDPHDPAFPIHMGSSRGPSDCDGISIKPNVVAPGVNIQTTKPDGLMSQEVSGTSFSCPHVAGGIALLREYNPNLTVDELKSALVSTAIDLGDPGPDNTYGYGIIDLAAALAVLPPNDQPELYIKRDYYTPPDPGTSTEMTIVLKSAGTAVSNVSVNIYSEDPHLDVTSGQAVFGDFTAIGDTAGNFGAPFSMTVDGSALPGERLPMRFEISGDGGYAKTVQGALHVGPIQSGEVFTHDAGNFIMSVGAMGQFGLHPESVAPRAGGMGYLYGEDDRQSLYEGSFLVGVGPDQVSDNARCHLTIMDADFQVGPGGRLQVTEGGPEFAEETRAAYTDAVADNPIGLFIEQRSLVDADPDADDYLILEFTIHNHSGNVLSDLHAGLYFDWDFPWPSNHKDRGFYNSDAEVGGMYEQDAARYRALAVLNPKGISGYQHFRNASGLRGVVKTAGLTFSEFSDAEKWDAMIGPVNPVVPSSAEDGSHLIATGPFTLQPGESIVAAFAVIGGINEFDVAASAVHARIRWSGLCDCPHPSDFNADGALDALDMHALIDVLFLNGADIVDALCPATRADFNSDGFPDTIDLNLLIDHLFAGDDPPSDPCSR